MWGRPGWCRFLSRGKAGLVCEGYIVTQALHPGVPLPQCLSAPRPGGAPLRPSHSPTLVPVHFLRELGTPQMPGMVLSEQVLSD